MNKYVAIDVESGGIGPEADLLTAYFGICDENFNLIEEHTVKLRPDSEDDFFHISAKALQINKINLVEHFTVAKPKKEAATELYNFLNVNTTFIEGRRTRLIPIGHNVAWDIRKISEKLINKITLDQFIEYRTLDTGTVGQFLITAGIIPKDVSASLGGLVKHYGLEFQGEAHTERADALACVDVMKKMIEQVKK